MNPLSRIASGFRKNRKVYVFFICIVIAAMFWFLLALTKDYPSTLEVNVAYENFPPHMIVANALPEKLSLSVNTSGYRLISLNSSAKEDTLHIDVLSLTGIDAGAKNISSELLAQNFIQQLGNDVEITAIQPDSILFDVSPSVNIIKPVKAIMDISFERQYDAVSPVKINPQVVTVTMPIREAGKGDWIETEKITAKNLRSSLKRKVKLIAPHGTMLSTNEVEVSFEVEKFTEGTVIVPVTLINVPKGLRVKIFPGEITVKYRVALSLYDKVKPEMFSAVADADASSSGSSDKLDVQIISSPPYVRSTTWQPLKVDFILRK